MDFNDEKLLRQLQNGDRAAFERVVRAHYEGVWRQQYLLCRDADLAADLTQETFAKAWRSLPGFEGRSSLRTWLYTIAVRVWQRRRRRTGKGAETVPLTEEMTALLPDGRPTTETLALRHLTQEAVGCALLDLPDELRAVLVLHFRQEMSHSEIADALHLPLGTVKTRLYEGLRRLRHRLVTMEDEGEREVTR